jgi:hypothetical protein
MVTGADANLVESTVEVALIVTSPGPDGVKVTAVPDFTAEVAPSVPRFDGLAERLTVLAYAPVPVTVGVQVAD